MSGKGEAAGAPPPVLGIATLPAASLRLLSAILTHLPVPQTPCEPDVGTLSPQTTPGARLLRNYARICANLSLSWNYKNRRRGVIQGREERRRYEIALVRQD